jgi:hypothetical protein
VVEAPTGEFEAAPRLDLRVGAEAPGGPCVRGTGGPQTTVAKGQSLDKSSERTSVFTLCPGLSDPPPPAPQVSSRVPWIGDLPSPEDPPSTGTRWRISAPGYCQHE